MIHIDSIINKTGLFVFKLAIGSEWSISVFYLALPKNGILKRENISKWSFTTKLRIFV